MTHGRNSATGRRGLGTAARVSMRRRAQASRAALGIAGGRDGASVCRAAAASPRVYPGTLCRQQHTWRARSLAAGSLFESDGGGIGGEPAFRPSTKLSAERTPSTHLSGKQVNAIVIVMAGAMFFCNVHRVLTSVLAVPIAEQFGFSMVEMGFLQSSFLWGYGLNQIPSGVLSDRYGGVVVMI